MQFFLSAVLISLAAVVAPSGTANTKYDLSKLDAELRRQCSTGEYSGVVLVRAGNRDIYQHSCGYADIINRVPNTPATKFKIYSTSKLFTALVIMKLTESGAMKLDAPISDYIPEVPPTWRDVTIRHLLQHTSGIADHTEALIYNFRIDHPSAMRSTLGSLTSGQAALKSMPGTVFSYNNFGFELLAEAASRKSDKHFSALLESIVFQPAGMTGASVEQPNILLGHPLAVQQDGLAIGYNGDPSKLSQATNYAFVQLGAGAIHATVADFVALDEAIKAGKIISMHSLQEMRRAPVPDNNSSSGRAFGLGLIVSPIGGIAREGHTGGTNGYISDFERYPEHDGMLIALSNRGFAKTKWLRDEVAQVLSGAVNP